MKHIIFILLLLSTSCTKVDDGVMQFTIKKGNHYCTHDVYRPCCSRIDFEFFVDDTWYYTARQAGINKVVGISDGTNHRKHSARLGWICVNGKLISYAYCYNGGAHVAKELTELTTGWHTGSVAIYSEYYEVSVDGFSDTVSRKCAYNERHLLWPYFGGHDTAPHDINVQIKLK